MDLSKIPTSPGCYLYKDNSTIIYVGKAKNLKKRVSSYFNKKGLDSKTAALVKNIKEIDFIATDSEVEALILENTLIKKHRPKYNINLKDNKQFACLAITSEQYPRLLLDRKHSGEKRFGPFTSGQLRDELRELLIKTFKIRTCNKLPKRACLRYHINLCSAPCVDAISKEDYAQSVKEAELVLRGKTRELIAQLQEGMRAFSKEKQYEFAMECKQKIEALTYLEERQKMQRQKKYNEDVINYVVKDDKVYVMLFNVQRGLLENKQSYILSNTENVFEDFLLRYYSEEDVPKEVILPQSINPAIVEAINQIRGKSMRVVVPKIGEKKQLLELVDKNIMLQFFAHETTLFELQKALKLQEIPHVIECFDISHLGGTNTVASMVQFRGGVADKSNYRRFKIKTVEGIDDFASMAEVVGRRYSRLQKEDGAMPDLIVIDGGKGQLHAALDSLRDLGLRIPMISLAKKFEEVYLPGLLRPLRLSHKTKALKLLQQIRDEAHRFAITYNRKLRTKDWK